MRLKSKRFLADHGFHKQVEWDDEGGTVTCVFLKQGRLGNYVLSTVDGIVSNVRYASRQGIDEQVWASRNPESRDGLESFGDAADAMLLDACATVDAYVPIASQQMLGALAQARSSLPEDAMARFRVADGVVKAFIDFYGDDWRTLNEFATNVIRLSDRLSIRTEFHCAPVSSGEEASTFPMVSWLHGFGYDLIGMDGHPHYWSGRRPIVSREPRVPEISLGDNAGFIERKGERVALKLRDYVNGLESYRGVSFGDDSAAPTPGW